MATVFFTGFPGQLGSELVPRVLSRPGDAESEVYHLAAAYDLSVGRDLATLVNVRGTRYLLGFAWSARGWCGSTT